MTAEENDKVPDGFQCRRCGTCCRWEGYVRMNQSEIDAAADFLSLSPSVFIEKYTRLTDDRRGLSLIEKSDGSCIFYNSSAKECLINPVKPAQCANFPWKWRFDGWEYECEGARHILAGKEPSGYS